MSTEANKAFIREYLEAINGVVKTTELIDCYIADDDLKRHIQQADAAMPGYSLDPVEMIAEGDLVSVRGTVRGLNSGSLMGIPASGKDLDFGIFITYRVASGMIVEHWMLTDTMAMMQQMGVIPA